MLTQQLIWKALKYKGFLFEITLDFNNKV